MDHYVAGGSTTTTFPSQGSAFHGTSTMIVILFVSSDHPARS